MDFSDLNGPIKELAKQFALFSIIVILLGFFVLYIAYKNFIPH